MSGVSTFQLVAALVVILSACVRIIWAADAQRISRTKYIESQMIIIAWVCIALVWAHR